MSLWSFEGCACERARNSPSQFPVVIAAGVHLFPFRTEQLSPPAPMVLGGQPPGRVGRRRLLGQRAAEKRPFAFHAARNLSRQSGSSSRSRRTRSATGGCVTNRPASPSSANGLKVYSGSVAGL